MTNIRFVRSPVDAVGPALQQGFSTLGEALDPTRTARAAAAVEQARYARARANEDEYQLRSLKDAQGRILESGAPQAGLYSALTGAGGTGAHNFTGMPAFNLMMTTQTPGVTPQQIDNAQLGAGQAFQNTHAGRVQAETAARERAGIAAGPGYARVAEDRRQFGATPTAAVDAAGNPVYVLRSDLGATGEDGAPRYRPPVTVGQVQGQVAQRAVQPGAEPIVPGITNAGVVLAPSTAIGIVRDDQRAVSWRMPDGSTGTSTESNVPEGAVILGRVGQTRQPTEQRPLTVPSGQAFDRQITDAVRSRINANPNPQLMQRLREEVAIAFQNGPARGNLPEAINLVLGNYDDQGVGNIFQSNTLVPRAPAYAPPGQAPAPARGAPVAPAPAAYAPPQAVPAAPAPAQAQPRTTSELPRIADDAGFAALPRGSRFIAPDGSVRTKP